MAVAQTLGCAGSQEVKLNEAHYSSGAGLRPAKSIDQRKRSNNYRKEKKKERNQMGDVSTGVNIARVSFWGLWLDAFRCCCIGWF